jgi:hypothetical protein
MYPFLESSDNELIDVRFFLVLASGLLLLLLPFLAFRVTSLLLSSTDAAGRASNRECKEI